MGFIPEEFVTQVIDRTDIVEIVSSYVSLKRAGRNFKALSPFKSEKTPSFVVSPEKQIFRCFSTGVGGNVASFVMQMECVGFPEAIKILADRAGLTVPESAIPKDNNRNLKKEMIQVNMLAVSYFHNRLLIDKSNSVQLAREYLKERGLNRDTVKKFRIGFASECWDGLIQYLRGKKISLDWMEKAGLIVERKDKKGYYDRFRGRIIFPIFDAYGNAIAFGARVIEKGDPVKYINSPETLVYTKGKNLYGLDLAKRSISQEDVVIIVEGYLDCVIPQQHGITNIVASCGTSLTVDQIRLIRRFTKNVILLYDTDAAGIQAMIRNMDSLVEEDMQVCVGILDEGMDPDSFIREKGTEIFSQRMEEAQTFFEYKLQHSIGLYGVKDAQAKAKVIEGMLMTINKFKNEIIYDGYCEELSRKLKVSKEAIVRESKRIKNNWKHKSLKEENYIQDVVLKDDTFLEERNILMLMLMDPAFIKKAKAQLNYQVFENKRVRLIVQKVYELSDSNGDSLRSNILAVFDDVTDQSFISELVLESENIVGDKEKMYKDCVNRIEYRQKEVKKFKLSVEIREAEKNNNLSRLNELLVQKNQLVRK